jgi:hypothetical protein
MRFKKLLFFAALLFCCGKVTAQDKLKKLDTWLADNAEILGGRDILLIYKDGKIIYSHSEDKMLPRQKMLQRYIARKKGEMADLDSYTPSRQPIASCTNG